MKVTVNDPTKAPPPEEPLGWEQPTRAQLERIAREDAAETPARLQLVSAARIEARKVSFVLGGRIPRGEVTIVCGVGGLGKSTMAGAWLAARASTGQLDGFDGPVHVLISSAEDDRAATLVPRLMADGADLERIDFIAPSSLGQRGLTLPDDTNELRRMVETTGARLVILDPVAAHLAGDVNADKDAQVRGALAPLSDLAHDLDVVVVVVAHLNKLTSADLYVRLSGSSGFFNLARSVLLLTRDPEADEDDDGARLLTHGKCNVGAEQPAVRLRIVPATVTTADGERIPTSRVELGDEAPHLTAAVALDPPSDEERTDIERAADELLALLADGTWRDLADVEDLQKRLRVSWKTMQRAARKLKVGKRKVGKIGESGARWQWQLTDPVRLPVDVLEPPKGTAAHSGPLRSSSRPHEGDITHEGDRRGHTFEEGDMRPEQLVACPGCRRRWKPSTLTDGTCPACGSGARS